MGGRLSGVRTRVRTRRVIPVTAPAAGADWAITVPGGHAYTVLSASGILTTAVGSTGDIPALQYTAEGLLVGRWSLLLALAASIAHRVTWSEHGVTGAMFDTEVASIPTLTLPAGSVIESRTLNIAGGDQWSGVALYVIDEWIHAGSIDLDRLDLEVVGVIEPGG